MGNLNEIAKITKGMQGRILQQMKCSFEASERAKNGKERWVVFEDNYCSLIVRPETDVMVTDLIKENNSNIRQNRIVFLSKKEGNTFIKLQEALNKCSQSKKDFLMKIWG